MIATALGWLGLSVLDGKTLRPLMIFAAVVLAAVAALAYTVHTLTALGYDRAVAECAAAKKIAEEKGGELETQLREANRDVAINFATANAKLPQTESVRIKKVTEYVDKNPAVRSCGLDADGLRIFNEALANDQADVSIRSGLISQGRAELAGSASGRSAFADEQSRNIQGRPFGFVATPRRAGESSRELSGGSNAVQAIPAR